MSDFKPMEESWIAFRDTVLLPEVKVLDVEELERYRLTFFSGAGFYTDACDHGYQAEALREIEEVIPMKGANGREH